MLESARFNALATCVGGMPCSKCISRAMRFSSADIRGGFFIVPLPLIFIILGAFGVMFTIAEMRGCTGGRLSQGGDVCVGNNVVSRTETYVASLLVVSKSFHTKHQYDTNMNTMITKDMCCLTHPDRRRNKFRKCQRHTGKQDNRKDSDFHLDCYLSLSPLHPLLQCCM